MNSKLKVAIVHYWLDNYRGGEKVVGAICELFPQADIYTHIYKPENLPKTITGHKVFTTFISKLPFAKKYYRYYLALMPLALQLLNLKKYDLIISSESGPAKGVKKRKNAVHICYCHTPMRYIWDMKKEYVENKSFLFRCIWHITSCYLRCWDRKSAREVDYFIANSKFISARIRKFYKRRATVIHPPVEIDKFDPKHIRKDFYLCVSQLVSYKKVELVVEAFNILGLPLCIIGAGDELEKIKSIANKNVRFLGKAPERVLKEKLETCKAFVYAAKEDFGIVFAEALSAGAPVIAYRKGGVRDIVKNGKTGLFFKNQTPESLAEAVKKFESGEVNYISSVEISKLGSTFSKEDFKQKMLVFIEEKLK